MKESLDKIKLYGIVNREGGVVWCFVFVYFFKSIYLGKQHLSQSCWKHSGLNQI